MSISKLYNLIGGVRGPKGSSEFKIALIQIFIGNELLAMAHVCSADHVPSQY
jgi:hypothetical protein